MSELYQTASGTTLEVVQKGSSFVVIINYVALGRAPAETIQKYCRTYKSVQALIAKRSAVRV